jgi:hypothetical protein
MSSPAPSSSSTPSCATASFTTFPTTDIACAVGSTGTLPSNTSSVFSSCCKSASVEQFNGACGYYCLSVDQSVADLTKCFMDQGVRPADIFCNGNQTATATGKGGASKTSGSGSKETGAKTGMAARGGGKMEWGVLGMVVVSVVMGAIV